MPRSLTVSNGNAYVDFDQNYVMRDITYPHVGLWDHTKGNPWRFGVWVDGQFAWSDGDFQRKLSYIADSLVTDVNLVNRDRLGIELRANDLVHFHRDVYLKKVVVTNLQGSPREVRLFFHHNPWLKESADCNTVTYNPRNKGLYAYKDDVWILANAMIGGAVGFHDYACGTKGTNGQLGTYVDAEDGNLGRNSVAQGSVDSVGGLHFRLEPGASQTVYYWMCFGSNRKEVQELESFVTSNGPEQLVTGTVDYWRYWVTKQLGKPTLSELCLSCTPANARNACPQLCIADLGEQASSLYRRSLLTIRANSDGNGAIIAAIDLDILHFACDTYSYMWPRDGAFCAAALDVAGHGEIPRNLFQFCARAITEGGYLEHKYNPSGSLASSWHSMVGPNGEEQLPIQEDETALMLVALWKHYQRHGCTEYVYESKEELFTRFVKPAANFMATYREPVTGLPKASYDLWEERRGILAFTVPAVYAGLKAAVRIGKAVGDPDVERWDTAADEIKAAFEKHMYSESLGRFVRMINITPDGKVIVDPTIDASMYAIWYMGLLPADDPRVVATMQAIETRLWVKTPVGGVARYENDYYHQVSRDVQNIAGNPWIICTLWLAEWYISKAKSLADLRRAKEIIDWTVKQASTAGLLAEQVNPLTGAPLSVSPLTWSHATYVLTVSEYAAKYQELNVPALTQVTPVVKS